MPPVLGSAVWRAWRTRGTGLGQPGRAPASPTFLPCWLPDTGANPHQIPRASGQSRAIPAAVRSGDTGLSKRKWSCREAGREGSPGPHGWCQRSLSPCPSLPCRPCTGLSQAGRACLLPRCGQESLPSWPRRQRAAGAQPTPHQGPAGHWPCATSPASPGHGQGEGVRAGGGRELLGLCSAHSIPPAREG